MYSKPQRWAIVAMLAVLVLSDAARAFQVSNNSFKLSRRAPGHRRSNWYCSAMLDDSPRSKFQQRMMDRLKKTNGEMIGKIKRSKTGTDRNSSVQEVNSLPEFKRVLTDNSDRLVVVWFYAKWCRACKGVAKGVHALSRQFPNITFIQVPVTIDNTTLHQGLGVQSVPFVHLYHPTAGLVDERKLTRKFLPGFLKLLQDYQKGECSLEQNSEKTWSVSTPYDPAPKAKKEEGTTLKLST